MTSTHAHEATKSVLVTGSEGLIGRPTCQRLCEAGYHVIGIDRTPCEDQRSEWAHLACDISQRSQVERAIAKAAELAGGQFASVVHLAAYYDFSGEASPLYQRVTIDGTSQLLRALQAYQVEQFIFSSTMLVHEPVAVGSLINEDSPLSAKWPYPQSKIDTERLIRADYADVPSVFLRMAGVYTEWGIQPTIVQQIKRIYERDFRAHFFPGDMRTGQSAVYLDDAVEAIVRTVECRGQLDPATPVLIGESRPEPYGELQEYIGRAIHGEDWTTVYMPPPLAKAGAKFIDVATDDETFIKPFMVELADDHYALDITRAKSKLHWQPQHELRRVLPTIIRHLLDDPCAWYARNGLPQTEQIEN